MDKDEALGYLTDDEMLEEIERRENEKRVKDAPEPRLPWRWDNFRPLIDYIEQGKQNIIDDPEAGYPGKDFEHYVFEEAMVAVYGPDIWKWWNENCHH